MTCKHKVYFNFKSTFQCLRESVATTPNVPTTEPVSITSVSTPAEKDPVASTQSARLHLTEQLAGAHSEHLEIHTSSAMNVSHKRNLAFPAAIYDDNFRRVFERRGLSPHQGLPVREVCGPLPADLLRRQSPLQRRVSQSQVHLPTRTPGQPSRPLRDGRMSTGRGLCSEREVRLPVSEVCPPVRDFTMCCRREV